MDTIKPNTQETPKTVITKATDLKNPNVDTTLEEEYIEEKSVTISPVTQYSAYRRANRAALKETRHVIGSSVTSCQILSSNKEEIEAYFPALIGVASNNAEFITKVKAYLSNIQFIVPDTGATLNTSFVYNKKSRAEVLYNICRCLLLV